MKEKLITTREASNILGLQEKDIINMSNKNLIPHFKLAGEFLRFRKDDILKVKTAIKKKYNLPEKKNNQIAKTKEFFYFNDFYIISTLIIITLLWIIIKDIAFAT